MILKMISEIIQVAFTTVGVGLAILVTAIFLIVLLNPPK
jgi:hypothetical protein